MKPMPWVSWTHDVVIKTGSFTIQLRISSKYVAVKVLLRKLDLIELGKGSSSDITPEISVLISGVISI